MGADTFPDLEHFLDLSFQGKRRGCSSGEHQARKLAKAVLGSVNILDDSAREGLKKFIDLAARAPNTAEELIG